MSSKASQAFELDAGTVVAAERFLREFDVAVRQARERSAYALFFLRLLYRTGNRPVDKAIGDYESFALERVAQLRIVFFPDLPDSVGELLERLDPRWIQRDRGPLESEEDARSWLASVKAEAESRGWDAGDHWKLAYRLARDILDAEDVRRCWADIGPIELAEPQSGQVARLRDAFKDFLLRKSSRGGWIEGQWVSDVARSLHKHLAFTVSIVLALLVVWKVEAVNSLLVNRGLWSLAAVIVVAFPVALVYCLSARRAKRSGRELILPLDVGGPSNRGLRAQALEPRGGILRYPVEAHSTLAGDLEVHGRIRRSIGPVSTFLRRVREPKSIVDAIVRGHLIRFGIYVAGWFAGLGLVFVLVRTHVASGTDMTIFLIFSILYVLLLACSELDFWDFFDPRPVRFRLLILGGVSLFALLLGLDHLFFAAVALISGVVLLWEYYRAPWRAGTLLSGVACLLFAGLLLLQWRTHESAVWRDPQQKGDSWRISPADWPFPGDDPVVVVASSGGGSRAAVYTALTLCKLSPGSMSCKVAAENTDSGTGSGEDTPCEACSTIGERIHAISSVSGGSLASAAYIARRLQAEDGDTDLVEAVSDDFLLPTLLGALTPGRSRGDSIEKHWQGLDHLGRECVANDGFDRGHPPGVALGDICLGDLAARWTALAKAAEQSAADEPPPFPLPLFNTSTLDGHDLVISPLPVELYTSGDSRRSLAEANPYETPRTTWVFYRDSIYGLEDVLHESFDPPLSAAVRASANFPFGFPLVRIQTTKHLFLDPLKARFRTPERPQPVQLTDGGAISNSGMWSLFQLLLNKKEELKRRGLLLIVIDASRMPTISYQDRALLALNAVIGDQAPIAQYLHRTMLGVLTREFGPHLAVTQIDLKPDIDSNILTTWALDRQTLRQLEAIFENQWSAERSSLIEKWEYLGKGYEARESATPPNDLIDQLRPPLD